MGKTKSIACGIFAFTLALIGQPFLFAQQATSPNYKVDETLFGTGGELDATSPSYRAQSSLGALGVGAVSSANYDAIAGQLSSDVPFLEMTVSNASVDFGDLSDTTTSYGAATGGPCGCSFTIRTYLSSSYVVLTMSNPPTSEGGAVLDAKTTQGAPSSSSNTEEFGINLVANTLPGTFGADPANQPDDSFADGTATTGYQTTNQFKYTAGDIVVHSPETAGNQAIGQTNYTISYIAKKKTLTEAGTYSMNHDLVAVATY